MNLRKGNMFDYPADMFLVTTNADVNQQRKLVMGRGAAKEAAMRFPGIAEIFGTMLKLKRQDRKVYGVMTTGNTYKPCWPDLSTDGLAWDQSDWRYESIWAPVRLGAFQVKEHWGEPARLDLIQSSAGMLRSMICNSPFVSKIKISLNFPGIGNGQLKRADVLPVIEDLLPDNVTVWTLD